MEVGGGGSKDGDGDDDESQQRPHQRGAVEQRQQTIGEGIDAKGQQGRGHIDQEDVPGLDDVGLEPE